MIAARLPLAARLSLAFAASALLLPSAAPGADGYGDLIGRVVLDGEAPELPPRIAAGATKTKDGQEVKDAAVCAASAVPDFSLVVGETGGIANVFLYPLRVNPRDVKPELQDPPKEPVVFDQQGCVFQPHCLIVRTDQPILLKSQDAVAHNVRFTSFGNPGINLTVPAGTKEGIPVEMKRGQKVPIPALCDFHPWMKAQWLVVDHPYAALTDADGNFKIEGLPAGKHRFAVWHESKGFLDNKLEIEIKADDVTELPDLKYKPSEFEKLGG